MSLICGLLIIITSALVSAHPIQEAGNATKCEFPNSRTGYLAVGKSVTVPGKCIQITCHEDLSISGLTCPTYFYTADCNLSEIDLNKEYPYCCPQVICHLESYRVN